MNRRLILPSIFAGALLFATGCGEKPETLVPVQGTVRFNGQPVSKAIISFEAKDTGVNMTSQVDDKGEFRVVMAKGAGLPIGEYAISINPYVAELATPANPTPWKNAGKDIPKRYRSPKTSGLSLKVTEKQAPFDIEMTP